MDIQSEKFKLIEWFVGLTDTSTLIKVAELKSQSIKKDHEPELEPLSVEELKARALESEEAIKQGEYTSFKDLKEEMKAW